MMKFATTKFARFLMLTFVLLILFVLGFVLGFQRVQATNAPTVTVKNGTYTGGYQSTYNQDFFLGIPYAQPPLGQLRLAVPQSLNTTWTGSRNVIQYAPECVGYGGDQLGYPVSEDCLVLNVVRPTGMDDQALPVGVWIHGGGYVMGGASDSRYNLSFIVQNSVKIGKPIIGVSIAYRLSGWGFLDGSDVRKAGVTNLGIRDQRLALHWIQENIGAFGGNPYKVTIWGESAGAGSVGIHLTAYNGRDDALFRSAIAESGGPILLGPKYNATATQATYDKIINATKCSLFSDSLACLRAIDFATLNSALNITPPYQFYPYKDGDIIGSSLSQQLINGHFVRVPLLIGANTDEGTSFSGKPINSDADFETDVTNLSGGVDEPTMRQIETVYPNIDAFGIPQTYTTTPNSYFGTQFKRGAAFAGDYQMIAPRRLACQQWAAYHTTAYCYRFNWPSTIEFGAAHFQEVAFVFNNLQGVGYRGMNPFAGQPQSTIQLSQLMSSMWAAFIHDNDPNGHGQIDGQPVGTWPSYDNTFGGHGQEFVFDTNVTSHAETDSYRADGIGYINSVWQTQFAK